MAEHTVKWYSDDMHGIPLLAEDQAGSLVQLLDAVLVDGFGVVTADSVVVSGGIATATRAATWGLLKNQIIEVSGATSQTEINAQWRVLSVSTMEITFDATGVPDGTVLGAVTIKTPGLGWTREFSSGDVRVYRSPNADSPRSYYRLDDSNAALAGALLTCYEAMTDVNTGFGEWGIPNPSTTEGVGFPRPTLGSRFTIVGDEKTVWFAFQMVASGAVTTQPMMGFGDYASFKPGDGANEFATPAKLGDLTDPSRIYWWFQPPKDWQSDMQDSFWLHEDAQGGRQTAGFYSPNGCTLSGYNGPVFPAVPDNGMFVTEAVFRENSDGNGGPYRGRHRGGYWVIAQQPYAEEFRPRFIDEVVGMEGRLVGLVSFVARNAVAMANYSGRVLFDMSGPWT